MLRAVRLGQGIAVLDSSQVSNLAQTRKPTPVILYSAECVERAYDRQFAALIPRSRRLKSQPVTSKRPHPADWHSSSVCAPIGWMWSLRCDWLRLQPPRPRNESCELAVIRSLDTFSRIKNDRCRLSRLSKIAHL